MRKEKREQISKQIETAFYKLNPTERKVLAYFIQEAKRQEKEYLIEQNAELQELQKTMDNETFDFILDVLITRDIDYIYEALKPMMTNEETHKEFQKIYKEVKSKKEQ